MAIIVFSPGLELVLIGHYLFQTKVPNAEALILPLPVLKSQDRYDKNWRLCWRCEFSPYTSYFAAVATPVIPKDEPIQLHVLKLDLGNKSFVECRRPSFPLQSFSGLGFSFHPARPELLICAWKNDSTEEGYVSRITVFLMVLESRHIKMVSEPGSSPPLKSDSEYLYLNKKRTNG